MPIYVYRCKKCNAVEEHIQRFSDPPMTKCEACGGPLQKEITGAAFHLKGGGWYADGYASTKPGGDGSGTSDGASKGDSGGGSADSGGSASDSSSSSGSSKKKGSDSAKGSST